MACHIHSQQRFEWLKEAIKSLKFQTQKPNAIYISISQETFIKGDITDIIPISASFTDTVSEIDIIYDTKENNINSEIKYYVNDIFHVFIHSKRLHQFGHIEYIHQNVYSVVDPSILKNLYIMFLDDDDFYHLDRINYIHNFINLNSNFYCFYDYSTAIGPKGNINNPFADEYTLPLLNSEDIAQMLEKGLDSIEYGKIKCIDTINAFKDFANYIVHFDVLSSFFNGNGINQHALEDNIIGLTDLVFMAWISTRFDILPINKNLYYRRRALNLNTKIRCWDIPLDKDISKDIDKYNLTAIFHKM